MVFRHPRRGVFLVSIAGPAANILLALIAGILLMITMMSPAMAETFRPLQLVLVSIASINLYLAFFNLIPLPPLDGSGVVASLLPVEYAIKYERMGRSGMFVIFALIILGSFMGFSIIGAIIVPPAHGLFRLFTGL
jgi:Zn-dependent protease